MKPELEALLKAMKKAGWQVEMRPPELGQVTLPEAVRERFAKLPDDYLEFLAAVSRCSNPEGHGCFLCADDFSGHTEAWFQWDWIERAFPPDSERRDDGIVWQRFWREHLPIFYSMDTEYDYLALSFAEAEQSGSVLHGFAPEFELPDKVADSFTHLCVILTQFLEQGKDLPGCLCVIL
jgi:hypothetical protein